MTGKARGKEEEEGLLPRAINADRYVSGMFAGWGEFHTSPGDHRPMCSMQV